MPVGTLAKTFVAMSVIAMTCAVALAQSTQPSLTLGEMQLRANEDMAKSDFAAALPLLQKVAGQLTDQPDQLGPVMEQIRVCTRQMQTATKVVAIVKVPDADTRTPHPALANGEVLETAIKDLGNFNYDAEKGGDIPEDVTRLEGCHVRTHGFMIPLDQAESISEFALVPSLFACCFGQPPQIQHTIIVHCGKGKAVSYFGDELVVDGTLHVREHKEDGFITSIFEIDATSVKPAAK